MGKKRILTFGEETNDIVSALNKILLEKGRLNTNPNTLFLLSYDSYDIKNNKTPEDSVCRYTISGLKHIFPLIKIELGEDNKILVEDSILEGFSALPKHDNHITYIKEIMLDIFCLYQHDENKIPKNLYQWYFKK